MPLTEQDTERLIELGVSQATRISKEQRAENKAKFTEVVSDPQKMQEAKNSANEVFEIADEDKDGLLNEEEFVSATKIRIDRAKSKGWHVAEFDE